MPSGHYERNARRISTCVGCHERDLQAKAGTVQFKVPKLRHVPFEPAIIERYRHWKSSVEKAMVKIYLTGVFVRRVEGIAEALRGSEGIGESLSRRQVSALYNQFLSQCAPCASRGKTKAVPLMAKAIHAQEDREAVRQKAAEVMKKLWTFRLEEAARIVESVFDKTPTFYAFSVAH